MKSPLNTVKESNVRFSPIRSSKGRVLDDQRKSPITNTRSPTRSPATDANVRLAQSEEKKIPEAKETKTEDVTSKEETTPMNVDKDTDKETTEEKEEKSREEIEQARVAKNIQHLMTTVKGLKDYYKLIDKIGEGSFSTVYKAHDLRRNRYINDDWEPQLLSSAENAFISPAATPNKDDLQTPQSPSSVLSDYVALKHIYHTSSPKRIANEIKILRQLKGSKCISPLITAFRQEDQIFVVMPYIQHDDFKRTFYEMELIDIRYYMKSLMTALQQLHHYKILHRDVKPNNFLYNIRKRTGYLIDFGLAETENDCKNLDLYVQKQAMKSPFAQRAKQTNTENKPTTTTPVLTALKDKANIIPSFTSSISSMKSVSSQSSTSSVISSNRINFKNRTPGYVRNDPRHTIRANRAGTRGFRAPEILLRYTRQTCAIDIWAAGVIMLCLFTGRYPFFMANDEAESIIEIAQIFGHKEMEEAALKYNRIFTTNIPLAAKRIPFERVCAVLNKERIQSWDKDEFMLGIDFLNRCLDLDHNTRMTATEALEHDFLKML